MTYKIIKCWIGLCYSHLGNEVIKTGLSWQEAYEMVQTLNQTYFSARYWFTNDTEIIKKYS